MWKLQGPEPLITFNRRTFDVPSDGKPIRIDLNTGKRVDQGGDLIISLKHQVWPRGTVERHHDWKVTIGAVDGGVVETKQRVMNLAPEDGYLPELLYQETADQQPWIGGVNVNLYVKSRGKLFSKVQMEVHPTPSDPPSYVALRWWVNPSGSRNLEYDPNQRITAQ
jgi:hypothetical protein